MNTDFFDFQIFASEEPENLLKQCFGDNEKNLLIVTKKAEEDVELYDLLQKILGAVGHNLKQDTTHLIIKDNQLFSFTDLSKNRQIDKALFFGINPKTAGLNFNVTPYVPVEFGNRTFLFAHDLTSISGKPALKKQLWGALQGIFPK